MLILSLFRLFYKTSVFIDKFRSNAFLFLETSWLFNVLIFFQELGITLFWRVGCSKIKKILGHFFKRIVFACHYMIVNHIFLLFWLAFCYFLCWKWATYFYCFLLLPKMSNNAIFSGCIVSLEVILRQNGFCFIYYLFIYLCICYFLLITHVVFVSLIYWFILACCMWVPSFWDIYCLFQYNFFSCSQVNIHLGEGVLKTFWRCFQNDIFLSFKMSSRRLLEVLLNMPWRRIEEDILQTHLEVILKTFW